MECVIMVLSGVREDQIESCLSALSLDEIDLLTKYVYKGLGVPRNNGPLFKWHAKVISLVYNGSCSFTPVRGEKKWKHMENSSMGAGELLVKTA
ncbi:unnamed protein product [Sphacelaria rigidula]